MSRQDLENAVLLRNLEQIRRLVEEEGLDVNTPLVPRKTALHWAVHREFADVVQCLLELKADANGKGGQTPLQTACRFHGDVQIIQLLIDHKADVNAKNVRFGGQTALHSAIEKDYVEAVRVMLDHLLSSNDPASIESALMCLDDRGRLSFHNVQNPEMAKLLLERPLLEDEDQVVPWVCREMLFAKDGGGRSLLDQQEGKGPLFDYLVSFTDLSLAVPERAATAPCCEHRGKIPPRHAVAPFNPNLNEFQSSIAKAFLNKWDHSFRSATADHHEDVHAMLLDELKYVIMAYLSTADIMKI